MILSSNLRGILAMVLATGVFIASDSATKFVLADIPLFEMVFLRGVISVTLCAIVIFVMGYGESLLRMFNPWLVVRSIFEVTGNFLFTFAIIYMPIADVTALAQICPLLLLVGAKLFYGEELGASRLVLIGLGITGALLVAQPGSTAASPYAVLGILTAICVAIRDLINRRVPGEIPAPVVAFSVLVFMMLAGLVSMVLWVTPVRPSIWNLTLIGLSSALMVVGHVVIFLAYRWASARTIAPFMYTLTLWSVLSGVVLFGDIPNTLAIVGMALIVCAGLLVIYADSRQTQ